MPSNGYDPKSQELPYPEAEAEYQDHGNNDSNSFKSLDYETSVKPYRKPFYRRRGFWWTCTISTTILLAIFIPLFVIVILPKVAQAMINASTMEILQMNMTNPLERSVQVSVDAAIVGMPSLFAAKVVFQAPVQVFWVRGQDDQPRVGQMDLGIIEKKAFAKAQFTQATTFDIADPQLFGEFAKVLMVSDSFIWKITAKIDVSVLGRTIKDLSMDKALNLNGPGLNNSQNFKILSFDLSDAPNGAGALVSIDVSILNPSPIGMSLGTLDIEMQLKNAKLGRVTARNATLIGHQASILHLEGTINRQTDPVALQELASMISNFLANTPTTTYGQGISILPDGVNSVSWMTAAIVSTKMSIPLLPPAPLNLMKEVNIKDMSLVMNAQQPWAPTIASTGISAIFQLPFNISLNITDIWDPRLTMGYEGVPIMDISTGVWNRTKSDMAHNNIWFTLPPSQALIRSDAHDTFAKFITAVTQQDRAVFDVLGRVQGAASTSIGQVNITVPFNISLPLQGINFAKMTPVIGGVDVTSANTNSMVLNATVMIDNPSVFAVEAGPATLHVIATVQGMTEYVGDVTISNLKLNPGPSPLQAFINFQPKNPTFRDAFFSEYVSGGNFIASIYGDANSSPIVSLAPLFEDFKLTSSIPGMKSKLILGGNGTTTVGQFLDDHMIMIQFQVSNPLSAPLWVHEFTANASWKGYPFGTIQVTQTIPIKPSGVDTSPVIGIRIPTSYQFWMFMISTFLPQNPTLFMGATIEIDMAAEALATVGGPKGVGYEAKVKYSQSQVPMFLKVEITLARLIGTMPRSRKRSLWKGDHEVYDESYNLLDELGPEPDKQDWEAYLGWLKRAVQLTYPDEAAADM